MLLSLPDCVCLLLRGGPRARGWVNWMFVVVRTRGMFSPGHQARMIVGEGAGLSLCVCGAALRGICVVPSPGAMVGL